jgi:NitT/TauT family transport system permease protein
VNRTLRVAVAGALGIAVFLVLWEALVRALDVRPFVLQAPTRIVDELVGDLGLYLGEAWVTAWHAVAGLAISLLVSLVIGSLLAMSRFAEDAAQPVLVLVLVTPWVAYFTSVVIWLGAGWRPVVFLVAFVTVPAFTFAMVAGLRSADPAARELLRSVDAARWEVLWRLRLPSAMPTVFAALRFNTGLALAAAYYGEGGNLSNAGLGAIGRRAAQSSQADVLWATIATTALLGVALLTAVTLIERAALRWHSSQQFDRITVR